MTKLKRPRIEPKIKYLILHLEDQIRKNQYMNALSVLIDLHKICLEKFYDILKGREEEL